MILLDTNVVSEVIRPTGDSTVLAWMDEQIAEHLFLSATVLAELRLGLALMPDGHRKAVLTAGLDAAARTLFPRRILPFDDVAADRYALLVARARAAGRAIAVADGQIAAVASIHGYAVATRDTAPFAAAGVTVVNPWLEPV